MPTTRLGLKNDFTDPDLITAAHLNAVSDNLEAAAGYGAGDPGITAGAEATNAIAVTVQLKDSTGANLAARRLVRVWLSDSQHGGEAAAAPDGGVAVTAGAALQVVTAGLHWLLVTDAAGQAVLTITESTAKTFWAHAAAGDRLAAAQIVFA